MLLPEFLLADCILYGTKEIINLPENVGNILINKKTARKSASGQF